MVLKISDLTDEHGEFLVRLARNAITEKILRGVKISPPKNYPKIFDEKAGVFVTINKLFGKKEELRGCIGYIIPIKPLIIATIDAAIAAATEDPRFIPVSKEELNEIIVEVTVLTPPQKITVRDPLEYPKKIVIGRDGLLLRYGIFSGTLLPQVPIEFGWGPEEFLDNLCWKAGLPKDCWKNPDVEIYRYEGVIWKELEPYGKVVKVELGK